jgi:hypothetical protein
MYIMCALHVLCSGWGMSVGTVLCSAWSSGWLSIGLRSWGSVSFGRGDGDDAPRREAAGCCCLPGSRTLSPPRGGPHRWHRLCCQELLPAVRSPASSGSGATWPSRSGTTPAWTAANHDTVTELLYQVHEVHVQWGGHVLCSSIGDITNTWSSAVIPKVLQRL